MHLSRHDKYSSADRKVRHRSINQPGPGWSLSPSVFQVIALLRFGSSHRYFAVDGASEGSAVYPQVSLVLELLLNATKVPRFPVASEAGQMPPRVSIRSAAA